MKGGCESYEYTWAEPQKQLEYTGDYSIKINPNNLNYQPETRTVRVKVSMVKKKGPKILLGGQGDGEEDGDDTPDNLDNPTGVDSVKGQAEIYSQRKAIVIESPHPTRISIIDMRGVLLYCNEIAEKVFIPVGQSGMYIVKAQSTEKSIVEKVSVR